MAKTVAQQRLEDTQKKLDEFKKNLFVKTGEYAKENGSCEDGTIDFLHSILGGIRSDVQDAYEEATMTEHTLIFKFKTNARVHASNSISTYYIEDYFRDILADIEGDGRDASEFGLNIIEAKLS